MSNPTDRRYSESHEWHKMDGDTCIIGITQFAADELTDITYVDLPDVGKEVSAGDTLGEIESVKATSDLVAGVAGVVTEVNSALEDAPETVNEDPFEGGWMVKLKVTDPGGFDALLDAAAYEAQLGD